MHATPFLLPGNPRWQRQSGPRLARSFLAAALLVAFLLATLPIPVVQLIQPGPEILVRLLPEVIEPLAEPAPEALDDAAPAATATPPDERPSATTEALAESPPADAAPATRDWHGQLKAAAKAAVDEIERPAAVNPAMDEKRRKAAEKFYASRAPEKQEIWDNVETDQLGRKILWAGDCYRIIDDPNPATYEIWREFQQYFVYCRFGDSDPQMLPWAEVIRARHLYLQYPDGEIPEAALREYVER